MTFQNIGFIFSFLIATQTTFGLKCYQCQLKNGVGDTGCDENPPPQKYLQECAQSQCSLKYSSNGTSSYERACVGSGSSNTMIGCIAGVSIINGNKVKAMECKCNGADGCNGMTSGKRELKGTEIGEKPLT